MAGEAVVGPIPAVHSPENGTNVGAKDNSGKNGKAKAKHTEQRRIKNEWPRETRSGHQPKDQNGDDVVTSDEWRGGDNAFRELDSNGDGVLSSADRALKPKDGRVHRRAR